MKTRSYEIENNLINSVQKNEIYGLLSNVSVVIFEKVMLRTLEVTIFYIL